MHSFSRLLAATTFSLAMPMVAHANLVSDGYFSSPSAGGSYFTYGAGPMGPWTVTGSVDLIGGYWQAPPVGGGSVDMDGASAGGLTQLLTTVSGQTYSLSFYLSGNPDGGSLIKTLGIVAGDLNATSTYTIGSNSNADMQYVLKTFTFAASGASTALTFTSLDDTSSAYGPAIGGVNVEAVATPEPAAFGILGIALASLAMVRRRGQV